MAVVILAMTACASPTDPDDHGPDFSGPPISDQDGSDGGADAGTPDDGEPADTAVRLSTGCPTYDSGVYSPFGSLESAVSSGTVAEFPWRGTANSYPESLEDFRGYGVPTTVECGSNKGQRDHLDVTSGCLSAVSFGGDKVGQIHGTSSGYYRSFALPYDAAHQRQVAWDDLGVEYRFYYSQWTGDVSGPGFKIFARYLTEYDLYVGSWRADGVVQIQKKQCGQYTVLERNSSYGPPAPNTWHTIRFEVVGNEQLLYLDGELAMTTTDDSITHGTAGIRIDSAEGAYIDDWKVYAP